MYDFPAISPPIGQVVLVTLSNNIQLDAEWDGSQWWSHLNDNPNAAPIANEFVVGWE